MAFKNWQINRLSLGLNAVPLDGGGYNEDEVMTVEWDDDWYASFTGADGEVTRSANNNFGCLVTLKYAQTADANDRLSAILIADLALPNGSGVGVFQARDLDGRMVLLGPRSWIQGPPALKRAKTCQVNEWKIKIADARGSFFGGH